MKPAKREAKPSRWGGPMVEMNPGGAGAGVRALIIRREAPPPVLHAALKRPLSARRASAGTTGSITHRPYVIGLVLAIVVFCGFVADFTQEAWPLAVLMSLPLAAIGFDVWSQARARAAPVRREPRIVADRRPVLLRPILILAQGRPVRIVAKLPRLLIQLPAQPQRKRGIITRKARLLSRRLRSKDH